MPPNLSKLVAPKQSKPPYISQLPDTILYGILEAYLKGCIDYPNKDEVLWLWLLLFGRSVDIEKKDHILYLYKQFRTRSDIFSKLDSYREQVKSWAEKNPTEIAKIVDFQASTEATEKLMDYMDSVSPYDRACDTQIQDCVITCWCCYYKSYAETKFFCKFASDNEANKNMEEILHLTLSFPAIVELPDNCQFRKRLDKLQKILKL